MFVNDFPFLIILYNSVTSSSKTMQIALQRQISRHLMLVLFALNHYPVPVATIEPAEQLTAG